MSELSAEEQTKVIVGQQLAGIVTAIHFSSKALAFRAIGRLSHCNEHHGVHHFAVIGQGQTVAMSKAGMECLQKVGLL